jgi:hypothetical protein
VDTQIAQATATRAAVKCCDFRKTGFIKELLLSDASQMVNYCWNHWQFCSEIYGVRGICAVSGMEG